MHVFSKILYFSIILKLFIYLPTQCPYGQGVEAIKLEADRCGLGEGTENGLCSSIYFQPDLMSDVGQNLV